MSELERSDAGRRPPFLALPYPLAEYLIELPGDYAKIALQLLMRCRARPGSVGSVQVDAGEALISQRSEKLWSGIRLDRGVGEAGRRALVRRVLERLERDGLVNVRAARPGGPGSGPASGPRGGPSPSVVRFLNFREILWPSLDGVAHLPARDPAHPPAHRNGPIPPGEPPDPPVHQEEARCAVARLRLPARLEAERHSASKHAESRTTTTCPQWSRLTVRLRSRIRPDLFERWFAPMCGEMEGDDLVLIAHDGYAAAFVRDNYEAWLLDEARALEPGIQHVRVISRNPALGVAGARERRGRPGGRGLVAREVGSR